MFCENCGQNIKPGTKFCENCGAKILYKQDETVTKSNKTEELIRRKQNERIERAEKKQKKSSAPILIGIIAVLLIALVIVIIVLVKKKVAGNNNEEIRDEAYKTEALEDETFKALDYDLYDLESIEELSPETADEYEAYFDALEYYVLGEDSSIGEESIVTEDIIGSEDSTESAEDDENSAQAGGASISEALSTTDNAGIMDFEWLHDVIDFNGATGAGALVDESNVTPITGDNAALNGGWKAYIYDESTERFLNAEISASGSDFAIRLNWKNLYVDGASYEETGSADFDGTWESSSGTAKAQGANGNLEITSFLLSNDMMHEYAMGVFYWPSGEKAYIGLMR